MHLLQTPCPNALRLERLAYHFARYAVVGVFAGYGLYKFTAQEAAAIFPLVSSHPLLGWLYLIFSPQAVSNLVGILELAAALTPSRPGPSRAAITKTPAPDEQGAGAVATLRVPSHHRDITAASPRYHNEITMKSQ
ncbi:hypothetical protein PCA31118_00334 [Pandoraea captiosa]|uniref:Uncharacterized protein n=1 Tax=Pandoraea captiosa TaxID=2508302 RepID=A0A5E4ZHZ3_9BURK|nr:DUF417 family protein [Pandoraea captiosa]VVE60734.1 hypothetical protein PCA31118_00334 [Pandoraea captiosa]